MDVGRIFDIVLYVILSICGFEFVILLGFVVATVIKEFIDTHWK